MQIPLCYSRGCVRRRCFLWEAMARSLTVGCHRWGRMQGKTRWQYSGLVFGALNRLNEHGLIIADYNSYHTYEVVDDSQRASELYLQHQGVSWDCDIEGEDRKSVPVKLHGVAMTVAGCELSRVVSQEPVEEYTEALKRFLQRKFRLRMRQIEDESAPVELP